MHKVQGQPEEEEQTSAREDQQQTSVTEPRTIQLPIKGGNEGKDGKPAQ